MSLSRSNSGLFSNNSSNKTFIDQVADCARKIYRDYDPVKDGYSDGHSKIDGYSANLIAGTHFIAGAGPREDDSCDDIESFIKNILLNDELAIEKVIAIGREHADYYSEKNNKKMYCQYQLDAKIKSGDLQKVELVKSEVTITDTTTQKVKHVDVTIIPLGRVDISYLEKRDGETRGYFSVPFDKRLEEMWELYQESHAKNIMIHCSSGIVRTGNLVLMFELMREYDKVFASGDPEIIAKEAMAVLTRIRQSRSVLVRSDFELGEAIRSTYYLHGYGLEKTAELQAKRIKFS